MAQGDDEDDGGPRLPRPKGVKPEQWEAFWRLWESGERNAKKLAAQTGAGLRTVYRWQSMIRKAEQTEHRRRGTEPPPPDLGDDPAPSDKPGWDHMGVARKAAASDKVHVRDRLRAVQIIELRRQWEAEHEREGRVDWSTVKLEDIPHEHRARLAGVLAEVLLEAKAPALAMPDTTEAQAAVLYQLGMQLHPEDADEVYRTIILPMLDKALARAAALVDEREAAARSVSAGGSEVPAEEYLSHV
jgi:hypothetical protein